MKPLRKSIIFLDPLQKDDIMEMKIDLQLFGEAEKTEKATPKKRRDAREEGQVLHSREVTAASILLATFLVLKAYGKYGFTYLMGYMTRVYKNIENIDQLFYEDNLMIGFTKTLGVFLV